jgi:hypothetical protein
MKFRRFFQRPSDAGCENSARHPVGCGLFRKRVTKVAMSIRCCCAQALHEARHAARLIEFPWNSERAYNSADNPVAESENRFS